MRAPAFWWQPETTLSAKLLSPLGAALGAVAAARMRRHGDEIGLPILCVGNPTVGGAGKTPAALHLVQRLISARRRPVFLTRGYGGAIGGPVVVDLPRHDARMVGDEALLLARTAPTVVARDRLAGGLIARRIGADVVVMDDGFQNPALAKTLSLLVIDTQVGIGNGLCVPAGPMRAPLAPQLARAQAVLLIGDGSAAEPVARLATSTGCAVLLGRLAPAAEVAARLFGQRALAFAGIGRPEKFFGTLRASGVSPAICRAFPDHHYYTPSEATKLLAEAESQDLVPVTTEKDAVRLTAHEAGRRLLAVSQVLPVRLVLEPPSVKALDALLARALPAPDPAFRG